MPTSAASASTATTGTRRVAPRKIAPSMIIRLVDVQPGGAHDSSQYDRKDSDDGQAQPANKTLSGGMAAPAPVEAVDQQQDQQRRQRNRDQRQRGAAKSIDQVTQADDPQPARAWTDLSDGQRLGELAVGRPVARQQVLVNNRQISGR